MSGDGSTNVHLRPVATNRQIAARATTAPHQIIDGGRHNAGDLGPSQIVLKVVTLWDRHDLPHLLPCWAWQCGNGAAGRGEATGFAAAATTK